jgi:hypothetical protein
MPGQPRWPWVSTENGVPVGLQPALLLLLFLATALSVIASTTRLATLEVCMTDTFMIDTPDVRPAGCPPSQGPRPWPLLHHIVIYNAPVGDEADTLVDGIIDNVSPEVIATCLMVRACNNDSRTSATTLIAGLD